MRAAKPVPVRCSPICPSTDLELPQPALDLAEGSVRQRQAARRSRRRCRLCPEPFAALRGTISGCPPRLLPSSLLDSCTLFEPSTCSCLPKSPPVHARSSSRPRALFSPWNSLVLKSIRFLSLTVFATLAWSPPVLAQSAPPPAGSDSDDLEVPSNPTVPGAAAPKPLPESSPESKPAPAPEQSKAARAAKTPRCSANSRSCARAWTAVEHARAPRPSTEELRSSARRRRSGHERQRLPGEERHLASRSDRPSHRRLPADSVRVESAFGRSAPTGRRAAQSRSLHAPSRPPAPRPRLGIRERDARARRQHHARRERGHSARRGFACCTAATTARTCRR